MVKERVASGTDVSLEGVGRFVAVVPISVEAFGYECNVLDVERCRGVRALRAYQRRRTIQRQGVTNLFKVWGLGLRV